MIRQLRRLVSGLSACAVYLLAAGAAPSSGLPVALHPQTRAVASPIQHVVVIFQENHTFDEVLGQICIRDSRCNSTTTGKISTGQVIPLHAAPDIVPNVAHSREAQTRAVHGGLMDSFDLINGCKKKTGYACYEQYLPQQIPSLAALARAFVISDRTFEDGPVPSWGAHLDLVAAQLDGFTGNNPQPGQAPPGPGWGCDSDKDIGWAPPGGSVILVPSCVPKPDGSGPYRPSPVLWVPTIMDRLDDAGLPWRIYTGPGGYGWAICPTFAECIYRPQLANVKPSAQVVTDAGAGKLPSLSLVIPCCGTSQHNGQSMLEGDNWISKVVSAIMNGPQWSSTAIFVTYDDCGCFYDHVAPPPALGIRVPMVIVSPYARPGFTDSNNASFYSLLAFTEHTFGLPPLTGNDAGAYDYSASFDFGQRLLSPIRLSQHPLPAGEKEWLAEHPPDPDDPT
jgi:Phosphoesterase family